MGVGPGTEVIVPGFTFISSSQAAQRLGAVTVPVDVDPNTYNIDVAAAAAAVTPRTRVIMPVHMAGLIADMDGLEKLAADAGVALLQDAAHAHGARWQGKRVGELGSVAAFSFQNGKLMTAGEGGAVLFPDEKTYEEAFLRHSCGRPRTDRLYHHQVAGSNMRMNEFSAAVLRAQLTRLDAQSAVRQEGWRVLSGLLAQIPGVKPQSDDPRADVNPRYMAMFRLPGWTEERRNRLVDTLVEQGLPAFATFRAIYRTPAFWETGAPEESVDSVAERCPNVEAISQDCVWLHHRTLLASEETLTEVAAVVAESVAAG
jgi:3-amino-5-hydroxybenzoate synthase